MKLFEMQKLANKTSNDQKIIGLRQGEKLIEELLSDDEKKKAKEKKDMWIIDPFI